MRRPLRHGLKTRARRRRFARQASCGRGLAVKALSTTTGNPRPKDGWPKAFARGFSTRGANRPVSAIWAALAALALCHPLPAAAAQPAADAPAATSPLDHPTPQVVYLDNLLGAPGTEQMGYTPYRVITAYLNGERWPRSLAAEAISNVQPTTRYSSVTFQLEGRYDRFQAMLGRDDHEQATGPAYCIFEVWADGNRIFRSEAMRSPLTDILVDSAFPKRSTPESIDLPVSGVRTLKLVTRYANEFSQEVRYANRAFGCVWGGARLILAPNAQETVEDPVLRATLRKAALKLLPSLPANTSSGGRHGGAAVSPKAAPPLHLAILPFRLDEKSADSPVHRGETEAGIRSYAGEILFGIQGANGPLLLPLSRTDSGALAVSLPAGSPLREDPAIVAKLAAHSHADLLLFGALEPFAGRWRVVMRLIDVRHAGKSVTLAQETLPVEASDADGADSATGR